MSDRPENTKPATPPAGGPGRGPGGGGPFGGGHGQMPAAKSKDFKGSLKRLGGYLKPHAVMIGVVILLAIVSVTFSILGPKILGKATNLLFEGVISQKMPVGAKQEKGAFGRRTDKVDVRVHQAP